MKALFQLAKPHLIAMGIFLLVFAVYFLPQLGGKVVKQGDIVQGMGMAEESYDYTERTGKYTLWTNAMFGGMPTYQIDAPQKSNLIREYVERGMQLFIKAPISWFFVAALCFYILMMVMGVHHWLAIIGGLAFALTTNNMLLYAAGHTSKFRAISYIPLIIAGMYLLLQKKSYLKGTVCFLVGLALNISANHYQMTYYLAIGLGLFMLVYLGFAIKQGEAGSYFKAAGIMLVCAILAIGPSFSKLYATYEYSKDTMRGKSELKAEASEGNSQKSNKSGLNWDYAMMWSNAPRDFFGTFIPGAVGGSSQEELSEDSELTKYFGKPTKARPVFVPLYWGGGDSTDGPTYFGAVVFLLLIIGFIIYPYKGFKYAVISALVIIALLSLGKYFESFNRIFFEHFPKYSTFRAHNSAMGVVAALFPIIAIAGASVFLMSDKSAEEKLKAIKIGGGVTLGLIAIYGILGPGIMNVSHAMDARYEGQFQNPADYDDFMDAMRTDRLALLRASTFRTFIVVFLACAILWFFVKNKLKRTHAILGLGILIVGDIWLVDKQYLNEGNFVAARKYKNIYTPRQVDQQIMQMEPQGRGYYRVLDLTINTFSESTTSYYHNTVGGYSAVKLQRFQDLIDSSFSKEINLDVLNMFNTKYIIEQARDPKNPSQKMNYESVQVNPEALGNAWFVEDLIHVSTVTDELAAIDTFNSKTHAIVHDTFRNYLNGFEPPALDSNSKAEIVLTSYEPNRLVYKCNSDKERFVVFSEIYYGPDKGWEVTLNGNPVEHIRVDYTLRGMKVPAGESEIIFEFNPQTYVIGERVSLASSILILLILVGFIYVELKPVLTASEGSTNSSKKN